MFVCIQMASCSIHQTVKDTSLRAYINADIHLCHAQARRRPLALGVCCVTSYYKHPRKCCQWQLMHKIEGRARVFRLLHLLAPLSTRLQCRMVNQEALRYISIDIPCCESLFVYDIIDCPCASHQEALPTLIPTPPPPPSLGISCSVLSALLSR